MCAPVAIAMMVASAVVSIAGQQQQAQIAQRQAQIEQDRLDYEAIVIENQKVAIEQDIVTETEREQLRQRLIGQAGAQRRGAIRVSQAALGQLVDVGSAGDITQDLAGEVAFKKLLSQHDSDLRKRNLRLEIANKDADIGLISFGKSEAAFGARSTQAAFKTQQLTTVLSTGSKLAGKFKTTKSGSIVLRRR